MQDREHFERRVGTTVRGKWTIDRLIGVGGMAAVYSAMHKIGRREALKILHPEVARNKDLRTRFEHEAHAVNRFTHPGVVEIRDIDTTEDGSPFLVMEFLEGEDLSQRAKRLNGIETDEMLRIVDDLLDVLKAAHERGIVHRDIKLDNLFLLNDGRLKVLDFGIARMKTDRSIVTRTGATLGTVAYMPPEQVKGMEIDARADLFAVGATMYRLIARQRIHDARSEAEMLVKMATEPAPPLADVAPQASPELCKVVDRALAFERERRYPDAATMQNDIRALRRSEAPPFSTARLAAGDDPKSKQLPEGTGAPALAAGAAVGAAAAGAVAATTAAFGEDPTAASDAFDATVAPAGAAAPSSAMPPMSGAMPSSVGPTVVEPTNVTPGPIPDQVPSLATGAQPVPSVQPSNEKKGPIVIIAVAAVCLLLGLVAVGVFAFGDDEEPVASQESDDPDDKDDPDDEDDEDDDADDDDDDDDDDGDDRRLGGPLRMAPRPGDPPADPGAPRPGEPGGPPPPGAPPNPGDPKPPGDPAKPPPPPPPKQGGGFKLPIPGGEPEPPPPVPGSSDDKKKKKKKKKDKKKKK